MSEQEKDEGGRMKAEALRAEVSRLHAERGPLVSKARAARMAHGVTSAEFSLAWFDVERVTRDLDEAEAELAKAGAEKVDREGETGAEGAVGSVPVWRNPAVEMPDDDIAVMAKVNDEEDPIRCVFHEGDGWYGVHNGLRLAVAVLCWMDVHEAAEILDAARKAVAHG